MNKEWFQGGLCGTKIQTSPVPLVYKQMSWNWLHSATFSLEKEKKTKVFLGFRLCSQLRTFTTTLLMTCPSDALVPAVSLCYSHPSIPRASWPQAPISSTHSCGHGTSWTSSEPAHQQLPSTSFHPSDPTGGTCPNTKIKTIVHLSKGHHMGQRTQEPQAGGSPGHQCTLQPRTTLRSLLWEPQHSFTTSAAALGVRYRSLLKAALLLPETWPRCKTLPKAFSISSPCRVPLKSPFTIP